MNAILIIGWKYKDGSQFQPECLYCGLDGVAAAKVASDAAGTGFAKLLRVGPSLTGTPLHTHLDSPVVTAVTTTTQEAAQAGSTESGVDSTPEEVATSQAAAGEDDEAPKKASRRARRG